MLLEKRKNLVLWRGWKGGWFCTKWVAYFEETGQFNKVLRDPRCKEDFEVKGRLCGKKNKKSYFEAVLERWLVFYEHNSFF